MLVSAQVREQVSAQDEFKLDFSGQVGQYFKKKRKSCKGYNSEAFRTAADRNIVVPTGRRLKQFLRGAEKITDGYIDLDGDQEGRVNIFKLAEALGYKIVECDDLVKVIKERAKEKAKWEYLVELIKAPKDNNRIDGFSIPEEKLIYCKEKIDQEYKNFVIAHELSHYLLRHKGMFFYKNIGIQTQLEEQKNKQTRRISNSNANGEKLQAKKKKRKLHEKVEYSEEADRLAAILLMPYIFMLKYKDINNDDVLAKRFQVPLRAIQKRRDEVIIERERICFEPSLHTEGVKP